MTIDTYPEVVKKMHFINITSTGNVFVARCIIPLVTIPVLDFVTIH